MRRSNIEAQSNILYYDFNKTLISMKKKYFMNIEQSFLLSSCNSIHHFKYTYINKIYNPFVYSISIVLNLKTIHRNRDDF